MMRLFGSSLNLVILDVDGVIIDIETNFSRNLQSAARIVGLSPEVVDPYLACRGDGSGRWKPDLIGGIKEMWPSVTPEKVREYVAAYRSTERRRGFLECNEARKTIELLWRWGMKVALCTTNDRPVLKSRLACLGLSQREFPHSTTGSSKYCKPDARALTTIAHDYGVGLTRAVYVGDWCTDWETARAAGMRFLAVESPSMSANSFIKLGVRRDHVIPSLSHLKVLITP